VWGNAALFIQNSADFGKAIFAKDTAPTARPRCRCNRSHTSVGMTPQRMSAPKTMHPRQIANTDSSVGGDDDRAEQHVRGA